MITDTERERLIEELKKIMNSGKYPTAQVLRMAEARKAIRSWDGTGAFPFLDDLHAWGLIPQEIRREDIDLLQKKLDQLRKKAIEDDSDELGEIARVRTTIRKWVESGMQTPMPELEKLTALGLWPLQPELVEATTTELVEGPASPEKLEPVAGEEQATTTDQVDLPEVPQPARLEPEPIAGGDSAADATTPIESAESQNQSEAPTQIFEPESIEGISVPEIPDLLVDVTEVAKPIEPAEMGEKELLAKFERAEALARKREFFNAIVLLRELETQADGELLEDVRASLDKYQIELNRLTAAEFAHAEAIERSAPNDFQRQENAWQKVLDKNPESTDAQARIEAVRRKRSLGTLVKTINGYIQEVEVADKSNKLPDLDLLRPKIESLEREVYQTNNDGLISSFVILKNSFTAIYRRVRDTLGIISTLVGQGQWYSAYQYAKKDFEDQKPSILDAAGVLGTPNEYVPTPIFFRFVSDNYIKYCRETALRLISQALEIKQTDPRGAKQRLEKAKTLITDPVLITDDQSRLSGLLRTAGDQPGILDVLEEVEKRIQAFDQATLELEIANSTLQVSARERLKAYHKARNSYPELPGLEEAWESIVQDLAAEESRRVESALIEAKQMVGEDKFDAALTSLSSLRKIIDEEMPDPPAGSPLPAALVALGELQQSIARQKSNYEKMLDLLKNAYQALKEYDADRKANASHLDDARLFYEQVVDLGLADHKIARNFYPILTSRQGDVNNWRDGERYYGSEQWDQAVEAFQRISASSEYYERTRPLILRARAAAKIMKARKALESGKPSEALSIYREAVLTFFGNQEGTIHGCGTDAQTELLAQDANSELERLKPIEEADQKVKGELEAARNRLGTIRGIVQSRIDMASKVDPLPEFEQLVDDLEKLREIPSLSQNEVAKLLSDVRVLWFETYLEGVKVVLAQASTSFSLVEAGCKLADTLENNMLISDVGTRIYYLRLQICKLDLQFANWFPGGLYLRSHLSSPNINWNEVEQNRAQRLDLTHRLLTAEKAYKGPALGFEAETIEPIEQSLVEVSRRRLLGEADQMRLEGPTGIEKAVKFLDAEVSKSERLAADLDILVRLIDLSWEIGKWDVAERTIHRLGIAVKQKDQPDLLQIWEGMHHVARSFSEDDLEMAKAQLTDLRQKTSAEDQELIDRWVKILWDRCLQRLLREASDAARKATDDGYLTAVRKYQKANDLDPENAEVRNGLSGLTTKIEAIVPIRCQQADKINIGNKNLESAIQQGQMFLTVLAAVSAVSDLLKLSEDLKAQILNSLDLLKPRVETWNRFLVARTILEKDLSDALSSPQAIDDLDPDAGGWQLDHLDQDLEELDQIANLISARKDPELATWSGDWKTRIDNLRSQAVDLLKLVIALNLAVRLEEFEQVIIQAKLLEEKWNKTIRQDGRWKGLDILIRHDYSLWISNRIATRPQEHRDIASKQKNNFDLWQAWWARMEKIIKEIRELKGLLGKDLLDLMQERSLKDLAKLCEDGLKKYDGFLVEQQKKPDEEPVSQKAKNRQLSFTDDDIQAAGILKKVAETLKKEIEIKQQEAAPYVTTVRSGINGLANLLREQSNSGGWLVKKKVDPSVGIRNLTASINRLKEYDPNNAVVFEAEELIRKAKSKAEGAD